MYRKFLKRALDIILSFLAIVILSPVLIVVAIAVRINLGSPIIFKQERPGKHGKIFLLYKFRTMKDPQNRLTGEKLTDEKRLLLIKEQGENAVTSDDERLTKFGKFLRALSLDELPELFNILIGDMSIVGPRPLAVIYLPYYSEEENHRHDVAPGLTGLAQVNGRNAISWEKRFAYDIEYVQKITFLKDLHIIFRTIAVVFERSDIAQGEERPEAFHIVRQRQLEEQKASITNTERG